MRAWIVGLVVAAACGGGGGDGGSGTGDETGASSESGTTAGTAQTTGDGSGSGGGGSQTGSSSTGAAVPCDLPADAPLSGRVWTDSDATDLSTYASEFVEGVDEPQEGVEVDVLGVGGPTSATTCVDGRYAFEGLDDGTYLVVAPDGTCAQRNCPRRLPDAIEAGSVKILTVGDSVPVEGHPVTFPARVATMLSPLADVEDANFAVSGSTSSQWVPGANLWTSQLVPNIDGADVVVISVGGNDFLNLVSGANLGNIPEVLAQAEALVQQIAANVREMATEARVLQPGVDVVFCLYPDYSLATATPPWDLTALLPAGTIGNLLAQARALIEADDEIVVVDLLEASHLLDVPLDDLLADPLHFNDAGHEFYANEVFMALGGASLGQDAVGDVHHYSFLP